MKAYEVKAAALPAKDPAGADQLVIAAAHGITRWAEQFFQAKLGVSVNLWDGPEGLGRVVNDAVEAYEIPNKRFHDIVTPRAVVHAVANQAGLKLVPNRKRRLKKK